VIDSNAAKLTVSSLPEGGFQDRSGSFPVTANGTFTCKAILAPGPHTDICIDT